MGEPYFDFDDGTFYIHGESEPADKPPLPPGHELTETEQRRWDEIPNNADAKRQSRPMTIMAFGVDHGRGAHSGNGGDDGWRTTVVALVRLDYLREKPQAYVRLDGRAATELMAQLAKCIAIRERHERAVDDDDDD